MANTQTRNTRSKNKAVAARASAADGFKLTPMLKALGVERIGDKLIWGDKTITAANYENVLDQVKLFSKEIRRMFAGNSRRVVSH